MSHAHSLQLPPIVACRTKERSSIRCSEVPSRIEGIFPTSGNYKRRGGAPGELAIANQNFNCGSAVSLSVAHLKNRLAQRNFSFIFPTSFYLFNWVFFCGVVY